MGNVTQLVHEAAAELHILLSRLFEAIYSACHHSWNRLIGSKPCVNFPAKESAVLLVGAEEGVGRTMALKFAQEGYTVFACIPNYHARIHKPEQAGTSTVSSLVYSWQMSSHKKKQRRGPESGRGSIIPLSFDYAKLEDRHHTLDTVTAYCARHSLQLSSLVLSPRSRDALPISQPSTKPALAAEQHCIVPVPLSTTKESVSTDLIQRDVIEPVLVLQDFLGLLTVNEGKIVILTGCSEAGSEVSHGTIPPCDAAREAIANQFQQELAPQGIPVSLVIAAPLSERRRKLRTPDLTPKKPTFSNISETSTHRSMTWSSVIHTIDDDTVFSVVLRAINSSYPRPIYYAGISVYIQRWAQVIPESLWSLVLLALNTPRPIIE